MSIFTKIPAAVASVDRGRPRFHKHGAGRHCDLRDSTVPYLVGDVAKPRRNRPLLIGGGAAALLLHFTTALLVPPTLHGQNPIQLSLTIFTLLGTRGAMSLTRR